MIGLDTNVVVRFLTNDDPRQSDAVKRRLKKIHSKGSRAFVSKLVMLETVWVLSSAYGFDEQMTMDALDKFCQLPMVTPEDPDLISRLLALYKKDGPNLSDQLILVDYIFNGCDCVITFDNKAKKIEGFADV